MSLIENENYKDIVNNLPVAIYYSIHKGNYSSTLISKQWEDWTGYSTKILIEKPDIWMKTIHPDDLKRVIREYYKASRQHRDYEIEYRIIHRDSKNLIYIRDHGTFSKVLEDKSFTYNGTLINITDKVKALEKINLSESKYREAYDRASFYKDLFAHDISNILQIINSSAELISYSLDSSEKSKDIENIANIIKKQVNRGSKLVENVRTLSELEEKEISLKKVEICELLTKSIEYVEKTYDNRNINIEFDANCKDLTVMANEFLQDIFENLLINSVKYNDKPDIEVKVNISEISRSKGIYLRIAIVDNGSGVLDERKKIIFEPGNRELKGSKGMGLGLSLVKKILDLYNGEIWVENRVKEDYSRGSKFIILLPK